MKICFFTIAKGEDYAHIANSLAFSFKRHTPYTLQVFTDFPDVIKFGKTLEIKNFEHDSFMFKFLYFKEIKKLVKADYYIFIDSDTFIVKPFDGLEKLLEKDPMVVFLENQLNDHHRTWHNKSTATLKILFNSITKKNTDYYNLNAGFFGFHNDHVDTIVEHAYKIRDSISQKLSHYTEEFVLSILASEYIQNIEEHLLVNNFDYFGIDTSHFFSKRIPQNKRWLYKEWLTSEQHTINPAIVHCPAGKEVLKKFSETFLVTPETVQNLEILSPNKKLNIIISCSRPYFLPLVLRTVEQSLESYFDYKVWIIFDFDPLEIDPFIIKFCENKKNVNIFYAKNKLNKISGGNAAKNYALSLITEGWVYQLDDDNILHPMFGKEMSEYIDRHPDKKCFIFHQDNRYFPKNPENIKTGIVDTAMYLIDRDLIGEEKIPEKYGGDGQFIEKIFNNNLEKSMIIQKVLCYYNKLKHF